MKNRRHLMVARRLRVETHPSMLIVTIREGEERGICSATLERLLRVVKDEVEDGSVVVIVLSEESVRWREESMKTLLHNAQLKCVVVGETRVVTNSRCKAEQIKSDRVEKVVIYCPKVVMDCPMDGRRIGKSGKVLENAVMDRRKN